MKKSVTGIMLTLLLTSMLTLAFNIQQTLASGTIFIRADGTIEGTDKIQRDGDVYTFIDCIADSIAIEKDNIVIDGAGYTLQGTGQEEGIDLTERNNITIKDAEITGFKVGIWVKYAQSNIIVSNKIASNEIGVWVYHSWALNLSGNKITSNYDGILLADAYGAIIDENEITDNIYGLSTWADYWATHNQIIENNITNNSQGISLGYAFSNNISGNLIAGNSGDGIRLASSMSGGFSNLRNTIDGNNLTANGCGITLYSDSGYSAPFDTYNNTISSNNIENNGFGICIDGVYLVDFYGPKSNTLYHNNFVNNLQMVYVAKLGSACILDDGYPSGGNYWSDYAGVDADADGIGDTPYFIDGNNQDNYPLIKPWSPITMTETLIRTIKSWNLPKGIENGLTSKLKDALHFLDIGNKNGAVGKLMDFVSQVEALRGKKLTNERADYLISEAKRIMECV